MRLKRFTIDGLGRGHVAAVEDEDAVFADVPRRDKGPANRSAGLRVVVDQHADVAVIQDGQQIESARYGHVHPRRLIPHVRGRACLEARKEGHEA